MKEGFRMFRMPGSHNPLFPLTIAVICVTGLLPRASALGPTAIGSKPMRIRIGSKNFSAVLENNETAAAFKALLPMKLEMAELNGNEKYARLSRNLPTNPAKPGVIQTGDLMVYGSRTLVLFYKSFPTPYEYTRLGRITDTAGLAEAIGAGSVTVTFEVE
jgi:hypothetical protein